MITLSSCQKGLYRCGEVKVLRWGDDPGLSSGSSVITGVLVSDSRRQGIWFEKRRGGGSESWRDDFEDGRRGPSQGRRMTSINGKRQGNSLS